MFKTNQMGMLKAEEDKLHNKTETYNYFLVQSICVKFMLSIVLTEYWATWWAKGKKRVIWAKLLLYTMLKYKLSINWISVHLFEQRTIHVLGNTLYFIVLHHQYEQGGVEATQRCHGLCISVHLTYLAVWQWASALFVFR